MLVTLHHVQQWFSQDSIGYKRVAGVYREMQMITSRVDMDSSTKLLLEQTALLYNIGQSNLAKDTGFPHVDSAKYLSLHNYPEPIIRASLLHSLGEDYCRLIRPDLVHIYEGYSTYSDILVDLITYCDLHYMSNGERVCPEYKLDWLIKFYGERSKEGQFFRTNRNRFMHIVYKVEDIIYTRDPQIIFP